MITDEQILQRHDENCRPRARIELAMVHCLLDTAARCGYTLEEHYEEPTTDILDLIFNLDEAHILVKDATGQRLGWIFLVLGNNGWDIVSDYTTNLEEFLKPVTDLSDKLQEQGGC